MLWPQGILFQIVNRGRAEPTSALTPTFVDDSVQQGPCWPATQDLHLQLASLKTSPVLLVLTTLTFNKEASVTIMQNKLY